LLDLGLASLACFKDISFSKAALSNDFSFYFKVEAIRNLFAALFLASIGMLIHVKFLWNHVDILLAAVILVIIVKSIVVAIVVKAFGYSMRTAFVVSIFVGGCPSVFHQS
jgi:predicted Kef-type K+ transport protein